MARWIDIINFERAQGELCLSSEEAFLERIDAGFRNLTSAVETLINVGSSIDLPQMQKFLQERDLSGLL